jgi:AraC family transcriptional regulator of adaptative response / DNA-3-methyladenine glycosylase II
VGPWTAHYLALRLGERDACPVTELGVQRVLAARVRRPVAHEQLAGRWQPWRALATTHLWFAEDAKRPLAARIDAA